MVDQLSSGMIGTISISRPPEDNVEISRDAQLALALQRLEYDEVKNTEEKEQMIMRDGELDTTMQHQEECKVQKLIEEKQRDMKPTSTEKAACPFLAPFSSVLHTLEIWHRLKSNKVRNGQYVFICGYFTPSSSGI